MAFERFANNSVKLAMVSLARQGKAMIARHSFAALLY